MKKLAWLLPVLVAAVPSTVSSATLGKYLNDGSNVVWFVQASDTHVNTSALKYYPDNFPWVLGDGFSVVNPHFIVVTGDLTDSTLDKFPYYGVGPILEEWQEYHAIVVDQFGMTPAHYFDVPGNHDSYNDGGLKFYLDWSVQGIATKATQQAWRVDTPAGRHLFFSVATTANDGKQWPADNAEVTDTEIAELDAFLTANADAEFKFLFGHHDYKKVKGAEKLDPMLAQHGVHYYSHGHEHDLGAREDSDGVVRFRVDSAGQSEGDNVGLWAVDNYGVSVRVIDARAAWPQVLVTAPADAEISTKDGTIGTPQNPPVPKACGESPVRALVFDLQPVTSVSFSIDDGAAIPMTPRQSNPFQWRGTFDATGLSVGKHTVTVEAGGSGAASATNEFFVEDAQCDLGPEDPDGPAPDGGTEADGGTVTSDGGGPDVAVTADGGISEDGGTATDDGAVADKGTPEDVPTVEQDASPLGDASGGGDTVATDDDSGSATTDAGKPSGGDVGWLAKPEDDQSAAGADGGCACTTVGI